MRPSTFPEKKLNIKSVSLTKQNTDTKSSPHAVYCCNTIMHCVFYVTHVGLAHIQ